MKNSPSVSICKNDTHQANQAKAPFVSLQTADSLCLTECVKIFISQWPMTFCLFRSERNKASSAIRISLLLEDSTPVKLRLKENTHLAKHT